MTGTGSLRKEADSLPRVAEEELEAENMEFMIAQDRESVLEITGTAMENLADF